MAISVKEFSEFYKCDISGIYYKIQRKLKNGEISELNVYKENGKMMLDDVAQEVLKPTSITSLKEKIETLDKTLKIYQQSDYESKSLLDDIEKEIEIWKKRYDVLQKKYTSLSIDYDNAVEKNKQISAEYDEKISEYENKIEELKKELANKKKLRKLFG